MKKFFIGFFILVTSVFSIAWFASCLTPFISPVFFRPMAFLALGAPYLAVCVLLLLLGWLFVQRWVSLALAVLLLIGYPNLRSTFALNIQPARQREKNQNTLRILSWNVRGFDNPSASGDSANSVRRQMFTYLKKMNADVVCFQEFTESSGDDFLSNTQELVDLGYKYYYKTNEISRYFNWGSYISGTVIFSRIPIIDSGKILLGDTSYREHLAYVDVLFQNKPVRIFSTHFKSINLFAELVDPNNKVIFHGDSDFVYKASKAEKLQVFAQEHAREADIAKAVLNKSPNPVVYVADMNSVPASYAYHTMKQGLQDVFVAKGFGLGTTLDKLPKTLRIDFLLADKRFAIDYYQKDDLHLSDHFPQFFDLSWKK